MSNIHADRILILDFGSQYTQLIARRVREAGVYCEIHPSDVDDNDITTFKPKGIILSGGPSSICDSDAPRPDPGIFELGIPTLGICYGLHAMAQALGVARLQGEPDLALEGAGTQDLGVLLGVGHLPVGHRQRRRQDAVGHVECLLDVCLLMRVHHEPVVMGVQQHTPPGALGAETLAAAFRPRYQQVHVRHTALPA